MWRRIMSLATALLLAGCAGGKKLEQFSAGRPALVLEEYFTGRTLATGIFEDRFGKVRRQFTVVIDGRQDGDRFILDERFQYSDGETQHRIWRLKRIAPNRYEGRADDIIGVADGRLSGNALSFRYQMNLKVGTKKDGSPKTWKVSFDDWMFLQADGVILNRAAVKRWGFEIGTITISFRRAGEGR